MRNPFVWALILVSALCGTMEFATWAQARDVEFKQLAIPATAKIISVPACKGAPGWSMIPVKEGGDNTKKLKLTAPKIEVGN